MRKRHGCHLVCRTITSYLWCIARRVGRFAQLVSVPSRICIVVSVVYYALTASCVAAVAQSGRTWSNQSDGYYVMDGAQQSMADSESLAQDGNRVRSEYTILTVRDVEDRERPDCVVPETRADCDQTASSTRSNGTRNSTTPSKSQSGARKVILAYAQEQMYREVKAACERLSAADTNSSAENDTTVQLLLEELSKKTIPFCSRYILAHVVTASCLRSACDECVLEVMEKDTNASIEYERFVRASYNFDGSLWPTATASTAAQSAVKPQLVLGDECVKLYKDWLCANQLSFYFEFDRAIAISTELHTTSTPSTTFNSSVNSSTAASNWSSSDSAVAYQNEAFKVLPCVEVCRRVEEQCPFFVPEPDEGSGDPAFVCGPLVDEYNMFGLYAQDACYVPSCHLEALRDAYAQQRSVRNVSASMSIRRCSPLTREIGNGSQVVLDLNQHRRAAQADGWNASETAVANSVGLIRVRVEPIPSGSSALAAVHCLLSVALLTSCLFHACFVGRALNGS